MNRKETFEEFLRKANEKHKDKGYVYSEKSFINMHTPMTITCPKHGIFRTTPNSHLRYECCACSYEKRASNYKLTTEEFNNKAIKIHGDKYDYSKSEYKGTKIPILIICPKHGEFWQKPNDHLSGKGCSKCNTSHLEKECEKFLIKNRINFETQKKFPWLGRQSLDFYLPDYNIAIECQGKQHFGYGGWKKDYDFDKIYTLDEKKYNICKENNIIICYLVGKENRSYIKDNIVYKEYIFTDLNDIFNFIKK